MLLPPNAVKRTGSREGRGELLGSRHGGFTLIELLVVIGIIAVLAGILLPTLAKAKQKAIAAACVNNQKQLILAFHLYANDFNDEIISSSGMGSGGLWPMPAISAGMTLDAAMASVQTAITNGVLWKYCPAYSAYHCPGDMRTKTRKPGTGWAYDSYARSDPMGPGGWVPQKYDFIRLTDVKNPSDAFVFIEESDPLGYGNGAWAFNIPPGWADTFAIFHGSLTIFSFVDGHVEGHHWIDPAIVKVAQQGATGVDVWREWPIDDRGTDFIWVANHYQYVGWKSYP
jgi:prepilin-type N-terminal cleavage/methylation domain-containing protein/prepilin-type processing-associated H-X9-DG protein